MKNLKDEERSYFGLGWEYARRNLKSTNIPEHISTEYGKEQFKEGFLMFRKSPTANYTNEESKN